MFLGERQHPVRILSHISRSFWLILIPAGKELIAASFDIGGWARTYWPELITLAVIFTTAVLRWAAVSCRIGDGCITAGTGPLGLVATTLYFHEITAVRTEQGPLYRRVGACTLYLETPARALGRSEIKLVISAEKAERIYSLIAGASEGEPVCRVRVRRRSVLLYSVMFSSAMSGLFGLAAAAVQLARYAGAGLRELAGTLNSGIETLERADSHLLCFSGTVPGLIILAGGAAAAGRAVSLVYKLLSSWGFTADRRGSLLTVCSGRLCRIRFAADRASVSCCDIRQSLLMKLLGMSSVHIEYAGSAGRCGRGVLIPMMKSSRAERAVQRLLPELGDGWTLNYRRGLHFHRVMIPERNITAVKLSQNPLQKRRGTCTAVLTSLSKRGVLRLSADLTGGNPFEKGLSPEPPS
ncbi:MAG: PH domain-containing protein [Ruminococcus sp.]|nr:PH domain-containing protein [Ruminococcus sp.]